MPYDPLNPKIDLFVDGRYVCSTNWSRTCRDAVASYMSRNPDVRGKVTASKSKR